MSVPHPPNRNRNLASLVGTPVRDLNDERIETASSHSYMSGQLQDSAMIDARLQRLEEQLETQSIMAAQLLIIERNQRTMGQKLDALIPATPIDTQQVSRHFVGRNPGSLALLRSTISTVFWLVLVVTAVSIWM